MKRNITFHVLCVYKTNQRLCKAAKKVQVFTFVFTPTESVSGGCVLVGTRCFKWLKPIICNYQY